MAEPVDISTKKYKNNIGQDKYEKGVNNVNVNPAVQAVAQKDSFVKNTLEGKGKMVKNLSEVSLPEWQNATKLAFPKLQEKVVDAVDSGKWPAGKVIAAGNASHNAAKGMKKGSYSDSYERYMAGQNAVKKTYGK